MLSTLTREQIYSNNDEIVIRLVYEHITSNRNGMFM